MERLINDSVICEVVVCSGVLYLGGFDLRNVMCDEVTSALVMERVCGTASSQSKTADEEEEIALKSLRAKTRGWEVKCWENLTGYKNKRNENFPLVRIFFFLK